MSPVSIASVAFATALRACSRASSTAATVAYIKVTDGNKVALISMRYFSPSRRSPLTLLQAQLFL